MNRKIFLLLLPVFILASCVPPRSTSEPQSSDQASPDAASSTTTASAAPRTTETSTLPPTQAIPDTETPILKPPDAEQPASGICTDPPDGEEVVMTIRLDVPDPRCARALPHQKLKLVNTTDTDIQVKLGISEADIPAGSEQVLEMVLGEYLEPGVHFIQVTPSGFAGELWLLEN